MAAIQDSLRELDKLQESLEAEILELEETLEARRAALEKLHEIKALAGGDSLRRRGGRGRGRGRGREEAPRGRSPRGENRERVYQVLKQMGTAERAVNIANAVREQYPDFGGSSFKTQVFQILQKDPRIEKVGKGLYRVAK
ncbi:MAG TPA: hypothetical protein VEI97_02810 [bacterium]|nr:hypothetical protein [bacterium]